MGAFMSAVTDEDRCGNRWMAKERSLNRIGPDVAPCTALGAAAAVSAPREPYILATIV